MIRLVTPFLRVGFRRMVLEEWVAETISFPIVTFSDFIKKSRFILLNNGYNFDHDRWVFRSSTTASQLR